MNRNFSFRSYKLKRFLDGSTEHEIEKVVNDAEAELRDQYQKLERIYNNAGIDMVPKIIKMDAMPAVLGLVLASALPASCFAPLAVVAALSASMIQILRAREDAVHAIRDSDWGYIWDVKHLNRHLLEICSGVYHERGSR